jgi:hypothetical protein
MPRYRLLVTLCALVFCCAAANAQDSTPDNGDVKDGIYSNAFFGLAYTYPKGWVVHGAATKERIMELGKERARKSEAMSDAAAEVMDKHTYQLLTVFRYALGTPDVKDNALIQVVAEDVRHAPAITDGKVYLEYTRELMRKLGLQPLQETPTPVVYSGRKFFRQDFEQTVEGMTIQLTFLVIIERGYALAFIFTGLERKGVDATLKTMDSLSFTSSR